MALCSSDGHLSISFPGANGNATVGTAWQEIPEEMSLNQHLCPHSVLGQIHPGWQAGVVWWQQALKGSAGHRHCSLPVGPGFAGTAYGMGKQKQRRKLSTEEMRTCSQPKLSHCFALTHFVWRCDFILWLGLTSASGIPSWHQVPLQVNIQANVTTNMIQTSRIGDQEERAHQLKKFDVNREGSYRLQHAPPVRLGSKDLIYTLLAFHTSLSSCIWPFPQI